MRRGGLQDHYGLEMDTIASRLCSVKLKMAKETVGGKRHTVNHNGAWRKVNGKL